MRGIATRAWIDRVGRFLPQQFRQEWSAEEGDRSP